MQTEPTQIIAIALASFSVGMNIGRLLTLWQKEIKEGNDESGNRNVK